MADTATRQENYDHLVLNTCVLAGRIMIESGSEMSRVNDTIMRIAKNAGLKDAQVYATLTGIIMSGGVKEVGAEVGRSINGLLIWKKWLRSMNYHGPMPPKKLISTNSVTTLSTSTTWWPRSRYGFKRWGPDWSAERWSLCFKTTCRIFGLRLSSACSAGSLLFFEYLHSDTLFERVPGGGRSWCPSVAVD